LTAKGLEMPETARANRRQAVDELKRTLILEAARRVFEMHGLEGASLRAIAKEAGYTAGAIYFHFPSKEAIYAALLTESLDRLCAAVAAAIAGVGNPADRLRATALAFFRFYAGQPHHLALGFYLFQGGIKPRGLTPDLNQPLNAKLVASLAPIATAAAAMGAAPEPARAILAGVFAHAVGLLLLQHTGRIRLFGCTAEPLMQDYLDGVIARLQG
jgi:AcrR family transcriptional regulator